MHRYVKNVKRMSLYCETLDSCDKKTAKGKEKLTPLYIFLHLMKVMNSNLNKESVKIGIISL